MPVTSGAAAEVFLGMNVKKFLAGSKRAAAASKRMMQKLKQHQGQMQSAAMGAGVALAAQVLFIRKVTNAAKVQEQAEKDLVAALERHTDSAKEVAAASIKQAAALQKVTSFGDETIIQAQALLATYGVTPEYLEAATKATLDFAAATGTELKAAALLTGKAIGVGYTSTLSRYGIMLDTSTIPKTEIATAVIDKFTEMFGGRAQKEVETFAGRQKQLSNAFGDLQETIGFVLIPTLLDLMKKIMPHIQAASDWVSENKKLVSTLIGVGVGGTALVFALSTLGLLLITLSNPLTAIIGGIVLLTMGLTFLIGKARQSTNQLGKFNSEQREIAAQLKDVNAQMSIAAEKHEALTRRAEDLRIAVAAENDVLGPYHRLLEDVEEQLAATSVETETLTKRQRELLEAMKDLTEFELNKMIEENKREFKRLTAQLDAANPKMRASARGFESQMMSTNMSTSALGRNIEELEALVAALRKVRGEVALGTGIIKPTKAAIEFEDMPEPKMPDITPVPMEDEKTERQAELDWLADIQEKLEWDRDSRERLAEKKQEIHDKDLENLEAYSRQTGAAASNFANVWASAFEFVSQSEKNFAKAFGKAMLLAMIQTFRGVISAYIAEIAATVFLEKGKAVIKAPLTFGGSLAAIPLIVAAGSAAIIGLSALENQLTKNMSFATGTSYVPQTGMALVHKGEAIIPADQNNFMGGGKIPPVIQHNHFDGGLHYDADIKAVGDVVARRIAMVRAGV